MKYYSIFLFYFGLTINLNCQINYFQKILATSPADHELRALKILPDQSILSSGVVFRADIPVIKFDPYGNILWGNILSLNSTQNEVIIGNSIVTITNDDFLIYGDYFGSTMGGALLIRLDNTGHLLWSKSFDVNPDGNEKIVLYNSGILTIANSQTTNGDLIGVLSHLDMNGNVLWSYSYGNGLSVQFKDLVVTNDNGIALTGWIQNPLSGDSDIFSMKLDSSANISWAKILFSPGTIFDVGNSVTEDKSGNIWIGGVVDVSLGDGATLLKLDQNGNKLSILNLFPNKINAYSIGIQNITTFDNVLIGSALIHDFDVSTWAPQEQYSFSISLTGSVNWMKKFEGDFSEMPLALETINENTFITSGWTTSYPPGEKNMYLLKGSGDVILDCYEDIVNGSFLDQTFQLNLIDAIVQKSTHSLASFSLVLYENNFSTTIDTFLCENYLTINEHPNHENLVIYPNPTTDVIYMTGITQNICSITITDILGRKVLVKNKVASDSEISVKHLPDGWYMLSMEADSIFYHKPFIKKSL